MELRNHTPFPPLLFESRDGEDRPLYVLVVRGTFAIVPGGPLRPHPDQRPPVEADEYHGPPGRSSPKVESDLIPPKPRADVTFNAVARAPRGVPAPEWLVCIRIGRPPDAWAVEKYLRVTGPRTWERRLGGWKPGLPMPCLEVPIRYEHAYGGMTEVMPGALLAYQRNPVGVGFFDPKQPPVDGAIPMPQVEDPQDPVVEPGQPYLPQGLGPIGRSWAPRLALAGTYDQAWLKERAPRYPADFDPAFHVGAHPDLALPDYLAGDETFELLGLHAEELVFRLPGYRMMALVHWESGAVAPLPLVLDTCHLDLEAPALEDQRVSLVWRSALPIIEPVGVVEVRMEQPAPPAPPPRVPAAPRPWYEA